MAAIAVIHVFISHFAIGGGLFLVVMETVARSREDQPLLAFLRRLTRFFVLVTVVAGALTGVAIWFVIGLLNPAATEVLIHEFVWGWAIEWTFFLVEICAAIVYLYGWDRMTAREHLTVGWIYFIAAWGSLAVINGILSFMLTPGAWLQTGDFWDGFFNETTWPQLVLRTGVCLLLAGLYAMLVASRVEPGGDASRFTRIAAAWGLIGLGITLPSLWWYVAAVPAEIHQRAAQMVWPGLALGQSWKYAGALALVLVVFGVVRPRWNRLPVAAVVMLLGLAWFGSFEWMRESLRKPWAVEGYTYATGLHAADLGAVRESGLLAALAYRTGDPGADLYRRSCGSCHSLGGGYRDLAITLAGMDQELIAGLVAGSDKMAPRMPPFFGTDDEAALVAAHVQARVDPRHLAEIHGLDGVALGEVVYDARCGRCHVVGGPRDVSEALADMDEMDVEDLLDTAEGFGKAMPAFTGDDREREALAEYLLTFGAIAEGGAS